MGEIRDFRSRRKETVAELRRKKQTLEGLQRERYVVMAEYQNLIDRRQKEIDHIDAQIEEAERNERLP
jgi:hypothetical protein